ncbi:MAG: hypothetical protein JRJ85_23255, partial [Deltaproteobacteria bacterium]|nr:hypothetical protein [Deltaproteobacteria bacterium]
MMRDYDVFIFGNISIGIIKTPTGEHEIPGGPILFAAWTAHQLGCSIGVLTKTALKDKYRLKEFPIAEEDLYWCDSVETTSNEAVYRTESMETRTLTNLSRADAYRTDEFPDVTAKVIQYCGPIAGDIDLEFIRFISTKAPVAMDAQSLMRQVLPDGAIENADWDEKREALPLIHYFKAD